MDRVCYLWDSQAVRQTVPSRWASLTKCMSVHWQSWLVGCTAGHSQQITDDDDQQCLRQVCRAQPGIWETCCAGMCTSGCTAWTESGQRHWTSVKHGAESGQSCHICHGSTWPTQLREYSQLCISVPFLMLTSKTFDHIFYSLHRHN